PHRSCCPTPTPWTGRGTTTTSGTTRMRRSSPCCPGTSIWHCPEWEAAPSQGDRPMREAPTEPPEMLTPPGPPPTAKMRTRTCPQEVPPAKSREAPTDSREAPADRTTAMVSHPVEDLPATKAEDRVAAACSRSAS